MIHHHGIANRKDRSEGRLEFVNGLYLLVKTEGGREKRRVRYLMSWSSKS